MCEHAWQRELESLVRMEQRAQEILDVPPGATSEQLKRAFRESVKRDHPDRNPNDEEARERFKDTVAAYRLLSKGIGHPSLLDGRGPRAGRADAGSRTSKGPGYAAWWRESFF